MKFDDPRFHRYQLIDHPPFNLSARPTPPLHDCRVPCDATDGKERPIAAWDDNGVLANLSPVRQNPGGRPAGEVRYRSCVEVDPVDLWAASIVCKFTPQMKYFGRR
jgi:hypothetical protein